MLEFNVKKHGKINLFTFAEKKCKNIKFQEWMSCVGETTDGKLIATDGYITVCNVDMRELSIREEWSAIPQSNKNPTIAGDVYKYSYGGLQYDKVIHTIDPEYFVEAIEYANSLQNEFDVNDEVVLMLDERFVAVPRGLTMEAYATINKKYFPKFSEYIKNGISSVEFLSHGRLYLKDNVNGSAAFYPYWINKMKGNMKLESGINEVENFYIIKL